MLESASTIPGSEKGITWIAPWIGGAFLRTGLPRRLSSPSSVNSKKPYKIEFTGKNKNSKTLVFWAEQEYLSFVKVLSLEEEI